MPSDLSSSELVTGCLPYNWPMRLAPCCPTRSPITHSAEQHFMVLGITCHSSGCQKASSNECPTGGQFFNLFNLGKNDMKTLKTKELKNGRLAMVSHCLVSFKATDNDLL